MQIQLTDTRLALRNSTTRLPFRYGQACLTWCPQAILQVHIVCDGTQQAGYSGDCLPPSWFDKSPDKDYRQQIDEMLAVIGLACDIFRERFARAGEFFPGWLDAQSQVHALAGQRQWPELLASFGVSMVERAIIDAVARSRQINLATLLRENALQLDASAIDPSLAGCVPRDWLPPEPLRRVYVRHTVGLSDPLTEADIPAVDRLDDGQPQSLEQYVQQSGVRYLKIKVRNDLQHDLARLQTIASVIERHRQADYRVTLDGNEQYKRAADFDELVAAIRTCPSLRQLWQNTLLIEQPLAREIALLPEHTAGVRRLAEVKPVIIDESDAVLTSFLRAIELGYRGVSSKNCKGLLKSVINAGIVWRLNQSAGSGAAPPNYLMSAEDLCCVGIVPVQSDLCLVASLGLEHVERNGHHYHRGLAYLPAAQQQAAATAHPDLYQQSDGVVRAVIRDGQFQIDSLQCVGSGFAVLPDIDQMTPAEQWRYQPDLGDLRV